ncbi:MAG: response regulator [candidate division Zixibacteria bacterium]|nr:response regulator [candidate division Zixibacteria bacterium]
MSNILVIDNNEHITCLIKDILTRENYNVDCAYSGFNALNLIDQKEYELIFVDLDLPDTNGINLINKIKKISPQTLSIIISAHYDFDWAIESIKTGVYQYIKKPFDIDEINKVAEAAIKEQNRMVNSGYAYKYEANHDNQNRVKNVVHFSTSAIIAALSLLVGFFIQQQIFQWQRLPLFWGNKEIIYLLFSFICCYSFIFITLKRRICFSGKKNLFINSFKCLTFSNILFMAIMFAATTFHETRMAIFIGYGIGVGGFYINSFRLVPQIMRFISYKREGKKKLTIKGFNEIEKPVSTSESDKILKSEFREKSKSVL